MSKSWFRMYSEIAHDPKVLILTEALRWRYVALLCLHCDGHLIGIPTDEIALALRIDKTELNATIEILTERGLLSANLEPHGWNKRQYISDIKDPTAAERQRRYRSNKYTDRNATVTRYTQLRPDTDTDTDKRSTTYSVIFDQVWYTYPKRNGDNPKRKAFRAWQARIKDGASEDEMRAGVLRYRKWCEASGKIGTEMVKQAATFFGPDKSFLESWDVKSNIESKLYGREGMQV